MFLIEMNFKNLTVELHFFYIFNTQVKFYSNQMLFTLQSKKKIYE